MRLVMTTDEQLLEEVMMIMKFDYLPSIIIYKLTAEPKRLGVPIDMEVARRSQKIE